VKRNPPEHLIWSARRVSLRSTHPKILYPFNSSGLSNHPAIGIQTISIQLAQGVTLA
jgi:hypothetical protein